MDNITTRFAIRSDLATALKAETTSLSRQPKNNGSRALNLALALKAMRETERDA